jgi:NAD(P)-dependent dehydrogenase (short-subunit alcohol dehydrogenase family)
MNTWFVTGASRGLGLEIASLYKKYRQTCLLDSKGIFH